MKAGRNLLLAALVATTWTMSQAIAAEISGAGATFILMQKAQDKADTAREALNFFDWAYHNGGQLAEQLDDVPMPAAVITAVQQSWKTIVGSDGKPVWTGHGS